MRRVLVALVLIALAFAFGYGSASAKGDGNGRNIVFDEYTVQPGQVIDGNTNVVFGKLHNDGRIRGDVNLVGGTYDEGPDAQLEGKLNDISGWSLWGLAPSFAHFRSLHDQDRRLVMKLASSVVVVLIFLLFPVRMRLALDRVERHPGLSTAVGTVAFVAVIPIAIMLFLSIIGIPLIALEIVAVLVCMWLGQGAIALLIGRRLHELVLPSTTPSPLSALILGLVVVSAAEILPIVGWVVTAIVWIAGLGCAIMSFISERTFENWGPARATIGGPPMNRTT